MKGVKNKIKYAYFSKESAILNGYMIYERIDGANVEITTISDEKYIKLVFDDSVYVGEVIKKVESHMKDGCFKVPRNK